MDRSKFKFKTEIRVRNYEVDWQGIVHNAVYLLYFETGRIEYFRALGLRIDLESIKHGNRMVLVRNEINYRAPARFDDLLDVHTRISAIRNTSYVMEGLLLVHRSDKLIGENVAVHVWLDPTTDRPKTISDTFRRAVQQFEGDSVVIEWPTYLA
ncbi:MAG TPA: thioesterase family protein [Bacteroidota bacterium]